MQEFLLAFKETNMVVVVLVVVVVVVELVDVVELVVVVVALVVVVVEAVVVVVDSDGFDAVWQPVEKNSSGININNGSKAFLFMIYIQTGNIVRLQKLYLLIQ
jgi:hypothetical protein